MRADRNEELYLRIGVRQGGCSGMSYTMDFELKSNLKGEDTLIDYEGFTMGKLLTIFRSKVIFSRQ